MIRTVLITCMAMLCISCSENIPSRQVSSAYETIAKLAPAVRQAYHDAAILLPSFTVKLQATPGNTTQPEPGGEQKLQDTEALVRQKDAEIDQKHMIIGVIVFLMVTKLLFMILAYRYWRKKKNLEIANLQQLNKIKELELQQKLFDERNRIAREMHDDLGTTLTSTLMAVEMVKIAPDASGPLEMIRRSSEKLSVQISEIIWNLNVNNDNLIQLSSYMLRFAKEFSNETGIKLESEERLNDANIMIDGYKRRSIYLIMKETLNNVVRHSGASAVKISIEYHAPVLSIRVGDMGKGFDATRVGEGGNGIRNIKQSVNQLNGTALWNTRPGEGTQVIIEIPLAS